MSRSDHRGFEDFENPLAEPERPRRKKPLRPLSPWEQQTASWREPTFGFSCCGTTYRDMTPAASELTRRVHFRAKHGQEI